jgi:hypothetical protein
VKADRGCIIGESRLFGGLEGSDMDLLSVDPDLGSKLLTLEGTENTFESRGVVADLPFVATILAGAGDAQILPAVIQLVLVPVIDLHFLAGFSHDCPVHTDVMLLSIYANTPLRVPIRVMPPILGEFVEVLVVHYGHMTLGEFDYTHGGFKQEGSRP